MFYMFLAVILFLNLLVAIIVDSYAMVKEDAEVSFWTERMLFIIEVNQMQILYNDVAKQFGCSLNRCCFKRTSAEGDDAQEKGYYGSYFRNWEKAFACFEDRSGVDENGRNVSNFLSSFIVRCACTLIISIWILLGILSAGYLWPPQVREWLFSVKGEKENERRLKVDDEDAAVNESLSIRLFHVDSKIDQLTVDSSERKQEIQNIKSELGNIMKILVKRNEIQEMKSELEDIKKMLIDLNSHIVSKYRSQSGISERSPLSSPDGSSGHFPSSTSRRGVSPCCTARNSKGA